MGEYSLTLFLLTSGSSKNQLTQKITLQKIIHPNVTVKLKTPPKKFLLSLISNKQKDNTYKKIKIQTILKNNLIKKVFIKFPPTNFEQKS